MEDFSHGGNFTRKTTITGMRFDYRKTGNPARGNAGESRGIDAGKDIENYSSSARVPAWPT